MYVAGLNSLFDEAGWGSDAYGFSNSIYKLEAGFRTRGSISGLEPDDYQIGLPYSGNFTAYAVAATDLTAPTVELTDNAPGTAIGDVTYTLTFSESVTGLATDDFSVINGSVTSVSGSGSVYSVVVTPAAGIEGNMSLTLLAGAVTDLAGNPNAASAAPAQATDTKAPTVSITDNLAGVANTSTASVVYTLTFSEPILGLDGSDFVASNIAGGTVSGSGTTWTVTLTPKAGVASGSIGLTLKAGAVTDAAGKPNAAASNNSQAIDTVAPVAPKLVTDGSFYSLIDPQVTFHTTLGDVVMELDPTQAPVTVANMLAYVDTGYYSGTLFHRVIPGFMAQGGGFTSGMVYKPPTYDPIVLESNNGLLNLRGTVAMARTPAPDSAASQFFVNMVDNAFLDYSSAAEPGYAVFGRVVAGMTVVDSMALIPTGTIVPHANVPQTEIVISSAQQTVAGSSITNSAVFQVQGLESSATWEYSLDSGNTWLAGSGNSLTVSGGSYAANAIQVRQTDAAGNLSAGVGHYGSALVIDTTALPIAGQAIVGSDGPDSLVGTVGNDTVAGGAGNDSYTFTGNRSQYILATTATGYQAHDGTPGRDGTDLISGVETLVFADSTVDLTMTQRAAAISPPDLKTLEELYVGFFNRIPEAAGLRYWIGEVESGVTLQSVADRFYSAGVQFEVFSADMTEPEFILAVYANVLGRSGATAPPQEDIEYWQEWLHTGTNSKGAMVLQMLSDSHAFFTGDPEVGWVIDLLDNKAEVANYFAVQQGLSYTDPQTNIARGIEIAAAITPTDTSAAIALIGVNEFSM